MDEKQDPKRRIMLHSYEQQLLTARRLAKHKVRMRLAQGLEPDDPDPAPKRMAFSAQISQELYDSLLFYPNANPVVEEIREELSNELGQTIEFTYPPGGTLRLAVREAGGLRHLNKDEQARARLILRRLTQNKVNQGLLEIHDGVRTIL